MWLSSSFDMDAPQATRTTTAPETSRQGGEPIKGHTATPERGHHPHLQPEKDLWAGRMHWHNAWGRVLTWVLINIGFIVVAWKAPKPEWLTVSRLNWTLLALFGVTTVFLIGGVVIRILQTRYRLTTQRLFIERGILNRTLDQVELIRVDDVRMQQSFIQRLLNVGAVLMMTTDVTDKLITIEGIKEPIRVAEIVRQQMRTLRSRSLYVENL